MKRLLLVLLLIVLVGPPLLLLLLSTIPQVQLDPTLSALGTATPVKIRITDPHGVRHISAWVEQNGSRYQVYDQARPATRLFFFKRQKPEDMAFEAANSGQVLTCDSYQRRAWNDFVENQVAAFDGTPFYVGIGNHEVIPPKTEDAFKRQFADWLDQPALLEATGRHYEEIRVGPRRG